MDVVLAGGRGDAAFVVVGLRRGYDDDDVVRLWIWGGAAGSLAGKVVAPEREREGRDVEMKVLYLICETLVPHIYSKKS
ncbi:hypothetical protein Tco_1561259 [Tanacetum coccineum]